MSTDDDPPYTILSPTKVRLGLLAREMARMNGMTEAQMAKHILQQDAQRASGAVQKQGEN
jgi:hypothetical protein